MHFKRLVGKGTVVSRYVLAMWILPILVSTVPFFKGIIYMYSEYVGLCTWSIDEVCFIAGRYKSVFFETQEYCNTAYIIGHNYQGQYSHAEDLSVNNYVRDNLVRDDWG